MNNLNGKVAIITGASRGLGRAIALKFAEEGAKLLVVDINMQGLEETKKLVEGKGTRAVVACVDTSKEEDTLRMADLAVKEFGGIDILVNNAAIGIERKAFFEISTEEWDRVMAVNLRGYWLCVKAVFPHMKNKGKGKIINIASESFFTGSHGFAHYVASKGGVIGLTRALAREVGDYEICINVVAAGFLANETGLALVGGDKSKYDVKPNCIKRVGTPEDVVGAVTFFASNESDFITGQTIIVDGGRVTH
jgi:NAD(P)-dependent dehydrogenase (short-subunit alcohol dehydrogenase family)